MPYYKTCPLCGAALDPGEICTDCRNEKEPATAATVTGSKVESELTETFSASMIAKPNE